MYFRVLDEDGKVLEQTNNATSKTSVKNAIINIISSDLTEEDVTDCVYSSLPQLLKFTGWTLEEQDEPFDGRDYDYADESRWVSNDDLINA